jgi:DNA-binding CsgD family transcriptional regulator
VRFHAGAWDDAIAEAETCLAMAEEEGTRLWNLYAFGVLILVAIHRGHLGQASELVAQADEFALSCGLGLPGTERIELGRALLAESDGRVDEAYDILRDTLRAAEDLDKLVRHRELGPEFVRLGRATARPAALAHTVQTMNWMATRAGTAGAEASALRCRALVDDDLDPLLRAVELTRSAPRPLERAAAAEDAGKLAASRSTSVPSVELLEEALNVYSEVGARRDADRVETELREIGVRRSGAAELPKAVGWDSLNHTEVTVVHAVAEGLTNREIGERMGISPRTVETHLSHVFRKVGLSSRVRLASAAIKRGVVGSAPDG